MEAAIEAAKVETQAAIEKRMSTAEENKNVQLEVVLSFMSSIVNNSPYPLCQEMLTALKDHSVRIKNVRTNMEDQMKPKAQSIIENIAKKEEASRYVVLCRLKS